MNRKAILYFCVCLLMFSSCKEKQDLLYIPTFVSNNTINVIVEIPAGTNKKIEYNKETKEFAIDKIDGIERVKRYLPYPANYGFVPSTLSDPAVGGDGDPIDVFLIAESLPTGSVIEAVPIAMLRLIDEGEIDDKIICIPADPALQIVNATSLAEVNKNFPKALEIIKLWVTYNDLSEETEINGYVDAPNAIREIKVCEKAFQNKK